MQSDRSDEDRGAESRPSAGRHFDTPCGRSASLYEYLLNKLSAAGRTSSSCENYPHDIVPERSEWGGADGGPEAARAYRRLGGDSFTAETQSRGEKKKEKLGALGVSAVNSLADAQGSIMPEEIEAQSRKIVKVSSRLLNLLDIMGED